MKTSKILFKISMFFFVFTISGFFLPTSDVSGWLCSITYLIALFLLLISVIKYEKENYQKNLIDKIMKASDIISQKSRYSSGEFLVVSPKFAEFLDSLNIKKQRKKKLEKLEELNKKSL